MPDDYPFPLLNDPLRLAALGEWDEQVYRDFAAYREGRLSEAEVRQRYVKRQAILCLDMTGFTRSAIHFGELESFLRIFDVQRVCLPIFEQHGAHLVRAFADDLTALFVEAEQALDASLEIHRRVAAFNGSAQATPHAAQCSIGIGFGDVFAIGPNLAMGDEMNRASKLGEDTARANEILITHKTLDALQHRTDVKFVPQNQDDLPFPYWRVDYTF